MSFTSQWATAAKLSNTAAHTHTHTHTHTPKVLGQPLHLQNRNTKLADETMKPFWAVKQEFLEVWTGEQEDIKVVIRHQLIVANSGNYILAQINETKQLIQHISIANVNNKSELHKLATHKP